MRPPPSSAVRRAVAAACLPLLVGSVSTGCSGGDEPPEPVIDQQAVTSEATPSPTPSATPAPEPWEKRTKAGAVAFVEHWVEVFNEATMTGDLNSLRELNGKSCRSCAQLVEAIDRLYSAGGSARGDGWTVQEIGLVGDPESDTPEVAMSVRQGAQEVRLPDGELQRFAPSSATYVASLSWVGATWKLHRLEGAS